MKDPILGPLAVAVWLGAVLLFGIWFVSMLGMLMGHPQ